MDYCNLNPGSADSILFISSPGQKNIGLRPRVFSPDFTGTEAVKCMREQCSLNQDWRKPSSTSLVLRKTRDKEIVEQYCNENIRYRPYPYPKLSKPIQNPKHRPLIRVTVIPNNNAGTQTKLRKHRSTAKKLQTTVSNHEGFFTAKNIFLVVAGTKKEKIYEIKTTGSDHSNGTRYAKDEEIPVEQNFQQLLSSLNMDKKKKKDKGKGKKERERKKEEDDRIEGKESGASLLNIMEGSDGKASILRDCLCSPPIETVSPRKSRVRITGKIGLTEDDRYVMRCAATIDGKLVESNYFQEQNKSPPPDWDMREIPRVCCPCPGERFFPREKSMDPQRESLKLPQRDEVVQTNIQNEELYRQVLACPPFMNPCPAYRSVETQYSPRNMNAVCFSNIEKLKIYSSKDQVVQCGCPQDFNINSKSIGVEADYDKSTISPTSCNSPLVIISVYPKQDSDEKFDDETPSINGTNVRPPLKEKGNGIKKGGGKKQGKGPRPGSPTPSKSPVKKETKKAEKPKGKGDKQAMGNKKGVKKEEVNEKAGQDVKERTSRSPDKRPSGPQFGISLSRCEECCMGCVGNRIAQMNTKRMMNWVSAKNDASNVSININGENELYDVLLRQGDLTTDLQVRQTLKHAKGMNRDPTDGASLQNFLPVPDIERRNRSGSFSQTFLFDQPNADNKETMDPSVPRLNVRDSIEISHRREEKHSSNSVTFTTSASSSPTGSKLAPMKHFKGDDCNLSNPVERDKEIRELLGIEKSKPTTSNNYKEFAVKAETDCKCSLHCFYRQQRKTNIRTVRNIQELRRFYTVMDDAVTQASDDDDVEYFEQELDGTDDIYNDDVCKDIDCVMCKDSQLLLEHQHECSPITYGCELGDRCQNKKLLCGSSSSSSEPRKTSYYAQETYVVPPRRSSFTRPTRKSLSHKKICVPKEPGREPCGIIVRCPYSDEEHEPRASMHRDSFERAEESHIEDEIMIEDDPSEELDNFQQKAPMYQQLILNRNINIYLQIEQFCKQKPIILSRKQYDKVKKTIECATAKKIKCICKRQSSRHSNVAIRHVSNKQIEIEEDEPITTWKKCFSWNKNKKKSKTFECSDCCRSDVNFVSSENEVQSNVKRRSSTLVVDANNEPRDVNRSKLAAKDSKQNNTDHHKSRKSDKKCQKLVLSHLVEDSPGGERKRRKSKPRLDEDTGQYEKKQYKNPAIEKIDKTVVEGGKRQSRKSKYQNGEMYEDQGKQSKKTKHSKKSLDDDEEKPKKKKKESKRKTSLGGGDENLELKKSAVERKESWTEHKRSKRKESEIPRDRSPQDVCCHPVETSRDNDGKHSSRHSNKQPETPTAEASQGLYLCKRCGRLKQLHPCGTCGRLNRECLHTCFCYEIKEVRPEPSLKNIYMNKHAKDKQYAASSTEVRYASVVYANYRHIMFSSTNLADENVNPSVTNVGAKNYNTNSLRTIFKGRRRSPTPNLGTSAYSLYSEYSDATSIGKLGAPMQPLQEKKPFLKRLMSCLVMRSKTSGVKIDIAKRPPIITSANTSVDSYHINTSLGAIELSSSIYDTSASFYSNHSIKPINSKLIKRGFLSSVRGFLANRKT